MAPDVPSDASRMQRTRLIAFVVFFAVVAWWLTFLAQGVHDHVDAVRYAGNAASLSRTFQGAPSLSWDDFVRRTGKLGAQDAMPNPGFTLLLAGVYRVTGVARVWYASLLAFPFFVFGAIFVALYWTRLFPSRWVVWFSVLVFSNHRLIRSLSRPLTEAPFWGTSMFLFWFVHRHPRRVVWAGGIVGFTVMLRFQAVFYVPLLLVLLVREGSVRAVVLDALRLLAGGLPFYVLLFLLPRLTGTAASGAAASSDFYLRFWVPRLLSLDPVRFATDLDVSLSRLPAFLYLTPVFWLLPVSVFCAARESHLYRLRWFVLLGVLSLTVVYSIGEPVQGRYLVVYVPLLIPVAWEFLSGLARQWGRAAGPLRLLAAGFFLFASAPSMAQLALCARHVSLRNLHFPNWAPLQSALRELGPDAVVATNRAPFLAMLYESRNLVALPATASAFLRESSRNGELDAVAFVLSRLRNEVVMKQHRPLLPTDIAQSVADVPFILEPSHGWADVLERDEVLDESGHRFRKVLDTQDAFVRTVVFRAEMQQSQCHSP